MILYISHNFFHYEAGNLCRLFFPYENLKVVENKEEIQGDFVVMAEILQDKTCSVKITKNNEEKITERQFSSLEDKEYNITSTMYLAFTEFCGYEPKWGMLTGIHPVKLYCQYVKEMGETEADRVFLEDFFVSREKLEICKKIKNIQEPSINLLKDDDFSLYISIPFCPTRCAYCSFVAQSIEKQKKLIEPYVEKLLEEIAHASKVAKETGLRLVTVYMGGGTPTTLNPNQLERVINAVKENFDMTACREFTVEAGRPDTIDREKLKTLKKLGISRISINPQSLEDKVLENIGRKHTAQDVIDAYHLSREEGMDNINMDLIAGLEGDTFETFKETMEKVIALNPENVTVHSLALKRSAEIFAKDDTKEYHHNTDSVSDMIGYSIKRLTEEGYSPYYLYRQSRMAGNQENTGWAKFSTTCEYNIYTMDETHTVIACGAGGVSKIKDPYSNQLERIFNFKYSYEYLTRFDEILKRKEGVKPLYEQFRQRLHQVHQSPRAD